MINNWSDVKHDPDMRVAYHYNNFQELVDSAEEISRDILNNASTVEDKAKAQVMRLILDGMVKCFDQFYCDVNQGFPGYKHAVWNKTDDNNVKVELSLAEITMIEEALDYAYEQVHNSFVPVFDAFSHSVQYSDDEGRVYAYNECCEAEELDGVDDAIAHMKSTLRLLYPHDGGIIEINA